MVKLAFLVGGVALVLGLAGVDPSGLVDYVREWELPETKYRYPNNKPLDKTSIEEWVVFYTNEERKTTGLVELKHDPSISDIARSHSEKMIQFGLSHRIQGMSPTDRATAAGYYCRIVQPNGSISYGVSENIASHPRAQVLRGSQPVKFLEDSQAMARALVTAWMNSPGHRANLLSSKALSIGVGIAIEESEEGIWIHETAYATQNFSRCN